MKKNIKISFNAEALMLLSVRANLRYHRRHLFTSTFIESIRFAQRKPLQLIQEKEHHVHLHPSNGTQSTPIIVYFRRSLQRR